MDEDLRKNIELTREKHQFITFLIFKNKNWKCGVVQNGDNRFISFYDFSKIPEENKQKFLYYADKWWWESGMALPFDAHTRKITGKKFNKEFDHFYPSLTMIHKKSLLEDPIGPVYSVSEKHIKRIKKKRIEILKA